MESRFSVRGIVVVATALLALCAAAYVAGERGRGSRSNRSHPTAPPSSSIDPFHVPDGTTPELIEFLRSLEPFRTGNGGFPPSADQQQRLAGCLITAADRILAQSPGGAAEIVAVKARLEGLWLQAQPEESQAPGRFSQALAEALESQQPEIADEARFYSLLRRLPNLAADDEAGAEEVVEELGQLLERRPGDIRLIELGNNLALMLGQIGNTDLAQRALARFEPLVRADVELRRGRAAEKAKKIADQMQDNLDKLQLVGETIEIDGTTLSGEHLKSESFHGQIVLVDFWATWCGPCLEDLPHVRRCYDVYHERGFEVIGICMDDLDQREKVRELIGLARMTWPVLMGQTATAGTQQPLAERYGVHLLPTAFLLDREGKVITPLARGATLQHLLERLLPKAAAGS